MYQVTQTAASFERDPEPKKALQQVQTTIQSALPLGPYDPAELMTLEGSAADREVV